MMSDDEGATDDDRALDALLEQASRAEPASEALKSRLLDDFLAAPRHRQPRIPMSWIGWRAIAFGRRAAPGAAMASLAVIGFALGGLEDGRGSLDPSTEAFAYFEDALESDAEDLWSIE